MKSLLEIIKLIFGPKALSKTIGTRTNVIKLPNNETKIYIKSDLNIEAASDKLVQKAKKEMEELIPDIPKMNDAERLIFEGNLRRLKNRLGLRSETDPTADVFQFGTKEKVTPGGIASLTEKAGQKSPPGTLMGNIESRIKQLEASGEDLSKMKGQTLDEIMGDVASSQQGMRQLEKQGLVRATARDIITSDIKSGKLKLPKELEKQILEGGGEPIDVLRNVYGEDALEVLDSLIPEFSKLRTSTEAEKLARSKFKFEPNVNRPKGSMSLEEAKKAEQENVLTPGKKYKFTGKESMKDLYKLEEKGIITRDDMNVYSPRYIEWLDAQIVNKEKLYTPKEWEKTPEVLKNKMRGRIDPDWEVANFGEDFDWDKARALEIDETQKLTPKKPEEPEEFATGGRVNYSIGTIPRVIKSAMKFFNESDPLTAYKKYLKYVKENAQKNPEKLVPEVGAIVTGSELIHRGLRRKLKEAYSDNEDKDMTSTEGSFATGGRVGFQKGSPAIFDQLEMDVPYPYGHKVKTSSKGLDYLTGIERRGYAEGKRVGFRFGSKKPKDLVKIAKKIWDDIFPTGDKKYDAQLVADELADRVYGKFYDELPQNVQLDLYGTAYDSNPSLKPMFKAPKDFKEAMQKGVAQSDEMKSLGLDVTKSDDFFKYENMKLSGELGPEHQADAYKQKIKDEFLGVIDENLMRKVEVDDDPQRLAEVYASIKEGLEMQKRGMSPEEIVNVMKKTPRTKNANGGLNYLMGY